MLAVLCKLQKLNCKFICESSILRISSLYDKDIILRQDSFVDVSSMAKLDMALSLVHSRVYSRLIRGVMISEY